MSAQVQPLGQVGVPGVAVAVAVAVGVLVTVGVGVAVGAATVGVAVGPAGVFVGATVGVAVGGTGVFVCVGAAVHVGVAMGLGVAVAVGVGAPEEMLTVSSVAVVRVPSLCEVTAMPARGLAPRLRLMVDPATAVQFVPSVDVYAVYEPPNQSTRT